MYPAHTLLSTVAIVANLSSACSGQAPVHEEELTVPDVTGALAIDVGAGDVSVFGADVSSVSVRARIHGSTNHVGSGMTEGSLTLFDDCNEEPCSVDLAVTFPARAALNIETGSGDLRLESVSGPIVLHTGSGDIWGRNLLGLNLGAETGSGDVDLSFTPEVARIHVKTGSGDVALVVSSGRYNLDVSTGSGDQHIDGVSHDPSAPSAIDILTGSGDVTIQGK